MLESIVSQSTSASRYEKYWIFFSKEQFHQNKTSYVQKRSCWASRMNIKFKLQNQFSSTRTQPVSKKLRRKVEVIGNAMLQVIA